MWEWNSFSAAYGEPALTSCLRTTQQQSSPGKVGKSRLYIYVILRLPEVLVENNDGAKRRLNVGREVMRRAKTQLQINDGCSKLLLAHRSSVFI